MDELTKLTDDEKKLIASQDSHDEPDVVEPKEATENE